MFIRKLTYEDWTILSAKRLQGFHQPVFWDLKDVPRSPFLAVRALDQTLFGQVLVNGWLKTPVVWIPIESPTTGPQTSNFRLANLVVLYDKYYPVIWGWYYYMDQYSATTKLKWKVIETPYSLKSLLVGRSARSSWIINLFCIEIKRLFEKTAVFFGAETYFFLLVGLNLWNQRCFFCAGILQILWTEVPKKNGSNTGHAMRKTNLKESYQCRVYKSERFSMNVFLFCILTHANMFRESQNPYIASDVC